jgi:hypothetical protein
MLLLQAAPVLESLQKEHKQEHGRLVNVTAAPEKARRQANLAMADLAAAQQLLAAADTKHMEVEANLRGVSEHLRQRQVRAAVCVAARWQQYVLIYEHTLHSQQAILHVHLNQFRTKAGAGSICGSILHMCSAC